MGYGQAIEARHTICRYLQTTDGQHFLREMLGPGGDYQNHFTAIAGMTGGDLYAVEGHARALIDTAAEALPLAQAVAPAILPASAGFVWLDRTIPTYWTNAARWVQVRALSWGITLRDDAQVRPWASVGKLHLFAEKPAPIVASNIIVGCWCEEDPSKMTGPFRRPPLLYFSCSVEPSSSLAALQDIDPDTSFLEALRFMVTFWLFIQQRILVPRSHHADRATARRLERQGELVQSPVNVVMLRHAEHADSSSQEHRSVEWRYQWLVRGHWRQQYFPSMDERRPIWILPHVKGPEEKPFKQPRETAFAVVR